jgi:SAM-dependent methyltransferase
MNEYDAFMAGVYDSYFTGVDGDIAFYVSEAVKQHGTVLELGCGTGRITLPLAQAGIHVTGLDNSQQMLSILNHKVESLPADTQRRITTVQGDMRDINLKRSFKQIFVPYRTFMHLHTPQDQVQTLTSIASHLAVKGRLLLNIYDPSAELANSGVIPNALQFDTEFSHPSTGNRVMVWYHRSIDTLQQIMSQKFIFEEIDQNGRVVSRQTTPLTLRYTHRYEMHYLLELCGFEVLDLYGEFTGAPYYGTEQIWIARRRD